MSPIHTKFKIGESNKNPDGLLSDSTVPINLKNSKSTENIVDNNVAGDSLHSQKVKTMTIDQYKRYASQNEFETSPTKLLDHPKKGTSQDNSVQKVIGLSEKVQTRKRWRKNRKNSYQTCKRCRQDVHEGTCEAKSASPVPKRTIGSRIFNMTCATARATYQIPIATVKGVGYAGYKVAGAVFGRFGSSRNNENRENPKRNSLKSLNR